MNASDGNNEARKSDSIHRICRPDRERVLSKDVKNFIREDVQGVEEPFLCDETSKIC